MKINLAGRIKKIKLAENKALFPLFEAIVNSIEAIADAKNSNGQIRIIIKRSKQQDLYNDNIKEQEIEGFLIEDNGIGFTSQNYDSFCTSDSLLKETRGGKGVGRFTWLIAFENVSIHSCYHEDGKFYERSFKFSISKDGIYDENLLEKSNHIAKTIIKFEGFREKYRRSSPKTMEAIANKIIQHCLLYFQSHQMPITFLEEEDGEHIELNAYFQEIISEGKTANFEINGKKFTFHTMKIHLPVDNQRIYYCAHKREVTSKQLDKFIPDIGKKFIGGNSQKCSYTGYVSGEYLDECVTTERTDFSFVKESDLFSTTIQEEEIDKKIAEIINSHLEEEIKAIRNEKLEKYEQYIYRNAPKYRILLKHCKQEIALLPTDLSNEKLEIELYKIKTKWELQVREMGIQLRQKLDDPNECKDYKAFESCYQKYLADENDIGKSNLADYIVHRKIILELMGKRLESDIGGYCLEKEIHSLIFPIKTTSDEIDYEDHNLWIIDEKLSYHHFLASDKPLNQIPVLNIESTKRPDIIIWDIALAAVNTKEVPYPCVAIIEFKRPGDEVQNNPIEQVYEYIKLIQNNQAKTINGRPFKVNPNTAFFCYIICDLTPKIHDFAHYARYDIFPDGLGYFGFNPTYKAYVEILTYDKVVQDAKLCNKILFDKLNLP